MGWTFANGQAIYQFWESSLTQTGAGVSAGNLSYNASIAPGTSRAFGFLSTWSGANSVPTVFSGTCGGVANPPPAVSITAPANNATFTGPANIPVTATASDTAPGTVTRVDFLLNGTVVGSDTTAPYSFTVPNVAASATPYTLTARATDNGGATATSAPVSVTVGTGNPPPTVTITAPANNATFPAPANIPINATATDTAPGTVTRVDFLLNGTVVGSDTTSPYSFTVSNVAASATPYTLTARATDNGGATATSAPVSVTVTGNVPPTVSITSPFNETGFVAPANVTITAAASDAAPGSVASVQFFNGATAVGAPDTTAPYSVTLSNLAVGSYTLTARATDNQGATTTSGAVGIGVIAAGGTTFVTTMNGATEVPPVATAATGTATLILAPDERAALVTFNFSNLSSPQTGAHIHGPADPGNNATGSLEDLDMPLGPMTNHLWTFEPVGTLTVQDQVAALKAGRLYINIHTANFPSGEIRGWFPPLVNNPGCDESSGAGGPADRARLLEQATFGPTQAELARVTQLGIPGWIDDQFTQPSSNYQNLVQLQAGTFVSYPVKLRFFQNAMRNPDQLRQRVAFALSQILIAADVGNQDGTGDPTAMVPYHQLLQNGAFGNYRQLLRDVTLNPSMGTYLNMVNNKKADPATNSQPNENYARELMQLFSIGTFRLNIDGSIVLDGQGLPVENYSNEQIKAVARALTGWTYAPRAGQPDLDINPFNPSAPMVPHTTFHDTDAKTLLGGAVIPPGQTPVQDLDAVIDNVFNHPNVGPFIGRQLIQHLVTSNPSPNYIARVAAVFNNNGQGVRGDLRAVVRAILLDPEARGNQKCDPAYGKLREPALFLTHLFRGLGATGAMWGVPQLSRGLGQNVFSPPDVFNYFQPDFRIVVEGQTIFSPPAQLLTTSTIIQRQNILHAFLFDRIQPGGDPNPVGADTSSVVFDFAPWDARAANPAGLVDALNADLMHNSMSPLMRQAVLDAVTGIQNNPRERVRTAIYIIASSMQYQVQR